MCVCVCVCVRVCVCVYIYISSRLDLMFGTISFGLTLR